MERYVLLKRDMLFWFWCLDWIKCIWTSVTKDQEVATASSFKVQNHNCVSKSNNGWIKRGYIKPQAFMNDWRLSFRTRTRIKDILIDPTRYILTYITTSLNIHKKWKFRNRFLVWVKCVKIKIEAT